MRSVTHIAAACAAALALSGCGGQERQAAAPADAAAAEALLADVDPRVSTRLIPRRALFGDPQRTNGRLSPDGANLAWLEMSDGALNISVAPVEDLEDARFVTQASGAGVTSFDWLRNNTHIVFNQRDEDGVEQHVHTVNVVTGAVMELAPGGPSTIARLAAVSWDYPDEVVIEANDRDPNLFDLHKYNVVTGAHEVLFENTEGFSRVYLDNAFSVRFAEKDRPDGARQFFGRGDGQSWRPTDLISAEDAAATRILDFDLTNSAWFVLSSRGRDSTALVRYDLASNERSFVAAVAGGDITAVLFHPITYEADAVLVAGLTDDWLPLTDRAVEAFADLDEALEGDFQVLSRTIDDRLWIVFETGPAIPGVYHLYNRETGAIERLTDNRPQLSRHTLSPMTPVVIQARDGLELASYLTLPAGADADGDGQPETRSPLVIIPDTGPGSRARYDFNATHQWLADRGYAALSVNVRGAAGFGKTFQNAGDGEIGARATEDLLDAAEWAVEHGVADPERMAAYGRWLGGYTSLSAAIGSDSPFACVVAYNAPFDLPGYVENAPMVWSQIRSALRRRLGDPGDPNTRREMLNRSLISREAPFGAAVLIVDGAPNSGSQSRVSLPFAQEADASGEAVTYVELPEDVDGLLEARNRVAFYATLEAFFFDCLGGMLAPLAPDLAAADVRARVGAEHAPTLEQALSAR